MNKKQYVKPDIEFQNFRLSTDLCASCDITGTFAPNECPITLPDFPFTLLNEDACEMYPPEGDDSICYHVPYIDNAIFGS